MKQRGVHRTLAEDVMWTSTLELDAAHVIPTKILGRFWRGAYFSSIAPFQVQNLPRQPLPAANWVRVRNVLAGICGSDLHLIFVDGDFNIAPAAIPSHSRSYPGHEVVGEVIEVGDEVTTLRVGDRVVLKNGPNCVTAGIQPLCRSCAAGNYSLCERGNLPGPQPFGGGWSEEMLLHEQQLFRVPANINDMQAVLLEPSAVAVHAVLRHLPQAGDHILIIGAGTIGLLILQAIRALAPAVEVSVLARHAFQVEQAARLGAQIIYPQDSYKEVQRLTGGQLYQGMFGNQMVLGGYDVIYDTIANKGTTHDSLRWTRAGGTVVMVGVSLHRMRHIDLTPIWYQEVNLIGTLAQGMETWPLGTDERASTFDITAELIQQNRLSPEKLITHSFALSDYRNALLTATRKGNNRAIKVVFDYSKQPPSVVPNVRAAARQRQRAFTPTLYTDPHPSQPLSPDIDTMLPPAPMPAPSAPLQPVSHVPAESEQYGTTGTSSISGISGISGTSALDEGVDDKTIVVSTSKFAHYQRQQPQPLEVVPSDEDEAEDQHDEMAGATEKFARINLHAIPTSTPIAKEDDTSKTWFADQLTQPVIPANALEPEDTGNDRNEAAASATPFFSSFDNEDSQRSTPPPVDAVEEMHTEVSAMATPLEHEDETDVQPQHLLIPNLDEIQEANEESFFVTPSLEESTDSANSVDAQPEQPPIPAWLAALHTAPQFLVPEDNDEVVTESQLEPEPASTPIPTTEENNTDSKTIVVSSPKRTRSKRRAEALKAKNTQGNGQAPASLPTKPVPSAVLTRKNQPTVTNNTRGTLQSVGELSAQDNDSASSQAQDENGTGNGKPVYEEP
ncbi:MAG: zinc-dependent alcohol dehydrogenase [Ktedonobacteraceae bacterium]